MRVSGSSQEVLIGTDLHRGRLHDLMSQDPVYGVLLTNFFETHHHPELAWMHHIACRRYAAAAGDLMVVNKEDELLGQKQVSDPTSHLDSCLRRD